MPANLQKYMKSWELTNREVSYYRIAVIWLIDSINLWKFVSYYYEVID